MGKFLTFAVAGSGKTTRIINSLDLNKRNLILTYTLANNETIKNKIIQKFGEIPVNVKITPFTSFLYSSCFRPLFHDYSKEKGLTFHEPERSSSKKTDIGYYVNSKRHVYHCRMGLSFSALNQTSDLFDRLERFYDHIYIDEVQDLASRDFDFILLLGKANLDIDLVGDFFQHTYNSSRDGNYIGDLFSDVSKYVRLLQNAGYELHSEQLSKSYRCSPTICDFVRNEIGIDIKSHRSDSTELKYITDPKEAKSLREDPSIVKLFYDNHHLHGCYSRNWGECKGEDHYESVCVVLNKNSNKLFLSRKLKDLAQTTKNKLYVAITRAKKNVYLCPPEFFIEPVRENAEKAITLASKKSKSKRRMTKI